MCGIIGFLDRCGGLEPEEGKATLSAMGARTDRCCPGAGQTWLDATSGIALGHRHRSVHSGLTTTSRSGRYVIAFDGEIDNQQEMLQAIGKGGVPCRGGRAIEGLLETIALVGIERALARLEGMFALALWDRETRQLTLARDRVGKKPLYYGLLGQRTVFASELRALRGMNPPPAALDPAAIEQYLRHGWIAAPRSIFKEIRKLPSASSVTLDANADPLDVRPTAWWSALDLAREGKARPFRGTLEEATDRLEDILGRAVERRMEGNEPLGGMLSGGIDSGLVVAMMQRRSARPVHTFTIGFDEPAFNEADHAAGTAKFLGTHHQAAIVDPSTYRDVLQQLPAVFDEPFADVSAIPNIVLARMAASKVRKVLTGEGGDEAFPGYKRYGRLLDIWSRLDRLPLRARRMAAATAGTAADLGWRSFGRSSRQLGKLARWAQIWGAVSPAHLTRQDLARISAPATLMRLAPSREPPDELPFELPGEPLLAMQLSDYVSYLPDNSLVNIDRTTTAAGIHARSPLLDPAVLAFGLSLPPGLRRDGNGGKLLLRSLLARYLPSELFERPKRGLRVPVGRWLKGPLHDWAHDLLAPTRLDRSGVLVPGRVAVLWAQHQAGWRNHENLLWALLALECWLEAWQKAD